MKHIAIAFVLLLSGSGQAFAGSSAELKVTGTLKAQACLPTFSGNGVIDYGTILASSLAAGQYTRLDIKEIDFNVNCGAAAKVALKATDNRVDTVVREAVAGSGQHAFGLGKVAGSNVGAYLVGLLASSIVVDGAPGKLLFSDNMQNWYPTVGAGTMFAGRVLSWTSASGTAPSAFVSMTGKIWVRARLNKPENLPLRQEVPLDGSATLEVIYL